MNKAYTLRICKVRRGLVIEPNTAEIVKMIYFWYLRSEIFTEFDEEIFLQIVEKITVKGNTLEFELMSGLKFGEKI